MLRFNSKSKISDRSVFMIKCLNCKKAAVVTNRPKNCKSCGSTFIEIVAPRLNPKYSKDGNKKYQPLLTNQKGVIVKPTEKKCSTVKSRKVTPNEIDETCSVCMEKFVSEQDVFETSCKHIFHAECMERNFELNPEKNCPVCRTSISDVDEVPEHGKISRKYY